MKKLAKTIQSTIDISVCQRCKQKSIVTDSDVGELVCGKCGFVLSEKNVVLGPEHRIFFDASPDTSRTGSRTSLSRHDKGLATIIDRANKDATGKMLSSSMKSTINRLRLWDNRSQAHKSSEINLRYAFNQLDGLKEKLNLTDAISEKTAYIYRKAIGKKLSRGRTISALLGASIYVACRDSETPRTLNDISDKCNIKKKDLAKSYRKLVLELDLKLPEINIIQYTSRIANTLNISETTKRFAIQILEKYQKSDELDGKNPIGVAASVVYLADVQMGGSLTQKQVAKAANVSEVTIRVRCKSLAKTVNLGELQNN